MAGLRACRKHAVRTSYSWALRLAKPEYTDFLTNAASGYLAPPYIYGGQMGDHVVFQWTDGPRTYAMSLHTWWPLPETAATLQAMVMALP